MTAMKMDIRMSEFDKENVTKVRKHNDMMAYRELVLLHQERVYFLIRRMVGSHEDAEDLVQDAFIKALKNIDRLKEPAKFGGWLNRMAVNLVIDFKRKKVNDMKVSLSDEMPPEMISERLVVSGEKSGNGIYAKEIRHKIDEALLKLPINHREAFVMFHYQKLSIKMIGEYMGCPEATVRSYIFRGIKKMRLYLSEFNETLKDN